MPKRMLLYLSLALLPSLSYGAEAVIEEHDGQIIVEYSGDPAEVKATQETRAKEEAKEEAVRVVQQERQRQIDEKMAIKRAATEARQAAEREAGEGE